MKKSIYLFITGILLFTGIRPGWSQDHQSFGSAMHEDLDHRISTRSICVPSPSVDVKYNFNISFAENVNRAIKNERIKFKQPKIKDYKHPEYYKDPVDYSHQIIMALREAYAGAYNIKTVQVPLDIALTNAAQNHSCKMIACKEFTHQSACTGSPKSRLSDQVGAWGSCLHGYSENIAINTSATVESAIEWAIFSMMYDDQACCRNGHRENFLKCTYDDTWRMGFGFQKGKFNFGGGRIYETWFLSWDFAKIGRTSGCTWEQGKGTKSCPDDPMAEFQAVKLTGQNNCRQLKVNWSVKNKKDIRDFELFIRQDGKVFKSAGKVSFDQKNRNYSSTLGVQGKKAEVYVKANLKKGSFVNSGLHSFDLTRCKEVDDPNPSKDNSKRDDKGRVADKNPPEKGPEDQDSDAMVVVPNPARSEIQLKNVPYGSTYAIFSTDGRLYMLGNYTGKIRLTYLRPGNYVVVVNGKGIQFVKL